MLILPAENTCRPATAEQQPPCPARHLWRRQILFFLLFLQIDPKNTRPASVELLKLREALLRAPSPEIRYTEAATNQEIRFTEMATVMHENHVLQMSAQKKAIAHFDATISRIEVLVKCMTDGGWSSCLQADANSSKGWRKTIFDTFVKILIERNEPGGVAWEEAYTAMIIGMRGVRRVPDYDKIDDPKVSTHHFGGLNPSTA